MEDRARTTRDRLYGDAEWNGRRFVVVDTGGLELDPDDPIEARVQDQARLAIREADVIIFVVDAATGMTAPDVEAAEILRRAKAPIVVAVNKADNERRELEGAEFYAMGWDELYAISAAHGRGTGDLMDALVWALPPETEEEVARKAREAEAEEWAEEVAAGHLDPYVVGDPEADDEDADDAGELTGSRDGHRSRQVGRRDGRGEGRGTGRDRLRRATERRQEQPRQRAARRGPGDRLGGARDDARRDRHAARLGPQRGRAHRHGRHPAARQGRVRSGGREVLDAACAAGARRGRTSPSSSSMRSRG